MNDVNAKSNTYPFVEVVLYSEFVRSICRVNQSRFPRQNGRHDVKDDPCVGFLLDEHGCHIISRTDMTNSRSVAHSNVDIYS